MFGVERRNKSGRRGICNPCRNAARATTRAAANAYSAAWHEANKERVRARKAAYYASGRAKRLQAVWKQANRAALTEAYARRRARQRVAAWGDRAMIRDIYAAAKVYRAAGIDCHVDHIIPLQGRTVSGLHVPENLTILLAEDNRRKCASFSPEAFS